MIEKSLLDYLSEKLTVPVFMEEPEKPPQSYVLIEKIGSSEENYISSATFAVQSYSKSLYDTASLNSQIKKTMSDFADCDEILRCKLNSDYNFTDTTTKRYRYQAVFDLKFYDD